MDEKVVEYRGKKIRIAPDGYVNITDVAQALDMTRQQWFMERMKNPDLYEEHLGKHRFDKRGPGSTTIDREGLKVYLDRASGTTPEAEKLKRTLDAYFKENITPHDFRKLECEDVLAQVNAFLSKLPGVPVELAEEFVTLRAKINKVV